MLAEVARQVLRHAVQLEEFAHARMVQIEAGFAELALGGVLGVLPFPGAHQAGEPLERGDFEAQRLAHFARGRASAIGDDVGGHGRAQLAEALVDVLDGALALVAAGKVDIDVGPLAALFGKEALEEQVHAHRIHRGDFERVADGAVGGRPAALRQDVVFAAEAHDVPDDQEIAGQLQLLDERQLALDLPPRALVIGTVAQARALFRQLAQERHLGLALGHGVARKFVAQVGQRELEARGNLHGVARWLPEDRRRGAPFRRAFLRGARSCARAAGRRLPASHDCGRR